MAAPTQTALGLITDSLRLLNVKATGGALTASEGQDGLNTLNGLIDSWTNERLMQPNTPELTHTLVAGTNSYTIGASGDINTAWPPKILSAHIRDGSLDYEMEMKTAVEFKNIYQKSIRSDYPTKYYYEKTYPLAKIFLYPTPAKANTLVFTTDFAITQIAALSTTINLPPGYLMALKYNLAVWISPEYKVASPVIHKLAESLKEGIRTSNIGQNPPLRTQSAYIGNNGRRDSRQGLV